MTDGTNNNGSGDLAPIVVGGLVLGGIYLLWKALNGKKKVFISYDHSEDLHYKRLLEAWNSNDKFKFEFDDRSPGVAIDSKDAGVIKAALTKKMKEAEYMLVIVGEKTAGSHWVNWEVRRALQPDIHLKLGVIKIERKYASPQALLNTGAAWSSGFTQDNVIDVLNRAESPPAMRPAWA
jgi:MTH538 TIR-like domain (DUF1863)